MRKILRLGVIALLAALALFFPHAGQFLVVEDSFTHADLAVVLSGDPAARALAARDLYQRGKVDRILVIAEPPPPAAEELVRLGLFDPELPSLPERILLASGVPKAAVAVLPALTLAEGTMDEAVKVRAYCAGRKRGPATLVIVTSKSATRRARFIFRQTFHGENVQVFAYPTSSYDPFTPERWWATPKNALRVAEEYQKFLGNLILVPIRLHKQASR